MKAKLLMFIVAGLMIAFTACSQPPQGQGPQGNFSPEDMAKRQTEMIKDATGIDEATTKKVHEINLKYANQMTELRKKYTSREEMREPMMKMREQKDAELKALLTDEQFQKYKAKQEEMRQQRQGGGGPGGPR